MCNLLQHYYNNGYKLTTQAYNVGMVIIIGVLLFTGGSGMAQVLPTGVPPIRNFTKKSFQAAPQNWDIVQGQNQIMYFANNLGLLQFDGTYWKTQPIGNRTIVRSVKCLDDGKIMVGGQGDIGYFEIDEFGKMIYHTIVDKIPREYQQFEDVWHIEFIDQNVIFNTTRNLFVWDGKSVEVFPFKNKIDKLVKTGNSIYFYIENEGLFRWENKKINKIGHPLQIQSTVTGIISWSKDTMLIATMKEGLFALSKDVVKPFNNKWNSFFRKNWINRLIKLSDGYIAVGTAQNGILVFNLNGDNALVVSTLEGLQNNNVLALYQDRVGDLWVSTEHGIDIIQYHAPYRQLFPDGKLKGAGYAAAIHQNQLFLGTTNGLYQFKQNEVFDEFEEVLGSKGQVWRLDTLDGSLYMGHHMGAFEVRNNLLIPIFDGVGAWKFIPLIDSHIAFGTYEGIGIFPKKSRINNSGNLLPEFRESSRIIIKDKLGQIWMSHPYRGVFKVEIDVNSNSISTQFINSNHGLPDSLGNYIFLIGDIPYVCSESGIFRYSYSDSQFVRDTLMESQLDVKNRIQLLYEDLKGNIWFFTEEEGGVLEIYDIGIEREIVKRTIPPLPEKLLGGFEFIIQIKDNQYIFGCEQGFVLLDKEALTIENRYRTLIHSVQLPGLGDTLIYSGHGVVQQDPKPYLIPSKEKAIRFNFSNTSYGEELKEFRYKLIGLEDEFSEWSSNTEVQFNNLQPGKYIFTVESKVGGQIQDSIATFSFAIPTPWYLLRTVQAIGLLMICVIIVLFFFLQKKRFESEKQEMENIHQQTVEEKLQLVEKTEQEIVQLKNEKLKAELQHKNNELASSTMHLVQKQELLSGVQHEMKKVLKHQDFQPKHKQELNAIIEMLRQDGRIDDDWEKFSNYFNEVHGFFLQKLKEKYPQLTNYDHKLCAYLRMNLSTKEIAALMNVSPRAIEGSRYRLRKKLDLPGEVNLIDFMQEI